MTLIIKEYETVGIKRFIVFKEIFSGKILRIKENPLDKDPKKFYKKDLQGVYYIPETLDYTNRCVCCYAKLPKNHPPMQARCNKCDEDDV